MLKKVSIVPVLVILALVLSMVGGSLAFPQASVAGSPGPCRYLKVEILSPPDGTAYVPGTKFEVVARITNTGYDCWAYCVTATIDIDGPASTKDDATRDAGHWSCCSNYALAHGESAEVSWELRCDGPGDVVITVTPDGYIDCGESVVNGDGRSRDSCENPISDEDLEADSITVYQLMPESPAGRRGAVCSPGLPNCPCWSAKYVSVNPQVAAVGQPVTVAANIANDGGVGGNYNVELKIDGQVEQSRMVSVGPQTAYPVSFTVAMEEPGTYTVDIGGQQTSFTVTGGGIGDSVGTGGMIALVVIGFLVIIGGAAVFLFRRQTS